MENNDVKTILISQFALPFSGIGSWTTMYNYYLSHYNHKIDSIIAPSSKEKLKNISYYDLNNSFLGKVKRKITGKRYIEIFKILRKIINPSEKYIIQIIDSSGIVLPLKEFLINKELREQCYLQYFYHGFSPFLGNVESKTFYESLDQYVVLTLDSYRAHQNKYTELTCAFEVLHNGVNSEQFRILNKTEKVNLRIRNGGGGDKLIFIWCSQDRTKKGLDLILKVWKQLILKYDFIELWIIGSKRVIEVPQVKNIGRVPNSEIATYYQIGDFYLFPSLWDEGFGLSLVEALKCGCYCIASNNGGIPEVLQYGKYGKLIEYPNFLSNWTDEIGKSIEEYLSKSNENPYLKELPKNLYSLDTWCLNMNKIIDDAKFLMQ